MRTRRKAICATCSTEIVWYGEEWQLWVHSEIPLRDSAGHTPVPGPIPPPDAYDWALGRPFGQIEDA